MDIRCGGHKKEAEEIGYPPNQRNFDSRRLPAITINFCSEFVIYVLFVANFFVF